MTTLDLSQGTAAPFGPRFASYFIDSILTCFAAFAFVLPGIFLFAFRDSLTKKQSVGRKVMGLRLVRAMGHAPLTTGQMFARNLTALLLRCFSFGTYSLAELVVHLARDDKRCITDLMFGTRVIEDVEVAAKPVAPKDERVDEGKTGNNG